MIHPLPKQYRKEALSFYSRYPATTYFILRGLAGRKHGAIDYLCPIGTPVRAPTDIMQTVVRKSLSYGNVIYARSLKEDDLEFRFAHLSAFGIPRIGKTWKEGEVFAWTGSTGFSSAPHLHWEALRNVVKIDPATLKLT